MIGMGVEWALNRTNLSMWIAFHAELMNFWFLSSIAVKFNA